MIFQSASFAELTGSTLYALLKLRSDVFVVEQECVYMDMDGRDLEPRTRHLWFERDAGERSRETPGVRSVGPTAYLRIVFDGVEARIGRVVTSGTARGEGLAGKLMEKALEEVGDGPVVLHAQAHLEKFYARYGFRPDGPEYVEDGIPHLPMRRN